MDRLPPGVLEGDVLGGGGGKRFGTIGCVMLFVSNVAFPHRK